MHLANREIGRDWIRFPIIAPVALLIIFSISAQAAPTSPAVVLESPNETLNEAVKISERVLRAARIQTAGEYVYSVCGISQRCNYPGWVHVWDGYWISEISIFLGDADASKSSFALLADQQLPSGQVLPSLYRVPDADWLDTYSAFPSTKKIQRVIAKPPGLKTERLIWEDGNVIPYISEHLFVLQGAGLFNSYGDSRTLQRVYMSSLRALLFLARTRDADGDGLIESGSVISDAPISAGTKFGDAERFEDQVLLYMALQRFHSLAIAAGSTKAAIWSQEWGKKIQAAVLPIFWTEEGFSLAVDAKSHKQLFVGHIPVMASGYAIASGIVPPKLAHTVLDRLKKIDFIGPGPGVIPPFLGGELGYPPGVYHNGGSGWARGFVPAVTKAALQLDDSSWALKIIEKFASAIVRDDTTFEYWNWEQYAGNSRGGGSANYSETASAFLVSIVHDLFGVDAAAPGYKRVRIAPKVPAGWIGASLTLTLPSRMSRVEEKFGAASRVDVSETITIRITDDKCGVSVEGIAESRVELVCPNESNPRSK